MLTCLTLPDNKTCDYYNVETKKMDVINFPDYKKWYKENKAVWNSRAYGNAQFKLHYLDEDYAFIFIKRQEDSYSKKPNLTQILERMNKVYTKNGDRINESTDWVHYFYQPSNNLKIKQDLRNYPASYWEYIRQPSYKYYNEDDYKKRAYSIYSEEKNFSGAKEKDPFLVYDDEKRQGLTVHKTDNVKYYVSVDIYLNRENNFLKYLANVTYVKHKADTVFPNKYPKDRLKRGYFEKYVYKVLNHNVTARIKTTKDDFILTTFRPNLRDNYRYFDFQNEKYYWDNSTWPEQLKNNFFSKGRRIVLYKFNTIKLKPDDFISPAEKEILALMTPNFF